MRQLNKPNSFIVILGIIATVATWNCGTSSDIGGDAASPQQNSHDGVFVAGSGFARRVCKVSTTPGRAACTALVRTDASGDVSPDLEPKGYGPADLRSAYRIPNDTTTATIAIVDAFDNPKAESDLAIYRSTFGLPPCTTANGCFRKVNQSGAASPLPPSSVEWSKEIALDLDMASAACPSCKILLVEADDSFDSLGIAVDTAVSLGAAVVSNSYGAPEFSGETSFDSHYHHPGVGIFVSSGDSGHVVEYPAASPFVTAVGGTTLNMSTTALRGWTETAWADAGSGCSAFEPKPPWQHDTGCSRRTVADISAVANPATPVAVFDSFGARGWVRLGGTSAAAPLSAGIYAAAGRAAADGSFSYTAAAGLFNDVTSGSNGSCSPAYLCTSGAGYDGPTGNGSPNARVLTQTYLTLDFYQNGAQGTASVSGNVFRGGGNTPATGTVNVNFNKLVNGTWTYISTAQRTLVNGHYEVLNWGVGVGQWRVRAVFPEQGDYAESESNYHEFSIQRVVTNAFITVDQVLNGQPGYASVSGNVLRTNGDPVSGTVNVNFNKLVNGTWTYMSTAQRTLENGHYEVLNWGVGVGQWRVRAVFPEQGDYTESESNYHDFEIKSGYRLVNRHSNKCMSLSGNNAANGTAILQWDCSGNPSPGDGQVFTLYPLGGGNFNIKINSSGKCVDVTGVSQTDGTYLQQWDCLGPGQLNQVWRVIPIDGQPPYVAFQVQHSGKCADVLGAGTGNGVRIGQWGCWWGGNQQWYFQAID